MVLQEPGQKQNKNKTTNAKHAIFNCVQFWNVFMEDNASFVVFFWSKTALVISWMAVKVSKQFLPEQKVFARGNRSEKKLSDPYHHPVFFRPSLLLPPFALLLLPLLHHHLLFLPSSSPPPTCFFLRVSLSGSSPLPLSFYFFYSFYFFWVFLSLSICIVFFSPPSFIFPSSCLSGRDATKEV